MRVLIVDGHADTVEIMVELMEQLGHDCRTAGTAKDAPAIVERSRQT